LFSGRWGNEAGFEMKAQYPKYAKLVENLVEMEKVRETWEVEGIELSCNCMNKCSLVDSGCYISASCLLSLVHVFPYGGYSFLLFIKPARTIGEKSNIVYEQLY
jgi:hypothetical protein